MTIYHLLIRNPHLTRRLFLAAGHAFGAARVEFAAAGRVERGGDITLEDHARATVIGMHDGYRFHQRLGVWVQRVAVQRVLGRDFHHVAQVHNADAVAKEFDDIQVVRDEYKG